jgi:hypothetical protein
MKKSLGWGSVFAILLLCALVALVGVLSLVWAALPLDHTTITIDGQTIALSGIEGWRAAAAIAAAVVAVFVALVVAALVVVFAVGVALLGIVVAALAVLASLALIASPLLFIGWLIWRLVRPAPHAAVSA